MAPTKLSQLLLAVAVLCTIIKLKHTPTKQNKAAVSNNTFKMWKATSDQLSPHQNNSNSTTSPHHCQTLWFAGFHDGAPHIADYARFYSAALLSAKESAPGLFQPILLVGHLEEDRESIPPEVQQIKDQFYKWVQNQGGIVIHTDELSFQEVINQYYSNVAPDHRQGPFFRLDIPYLIIEHKLLEREGVCRHDDVILYTDCDILFMNVTASSLKEAKDLVRGNNTNSSIVAYGTESSKRNYAENTGVMFFSTSKFGSKVNDIMRFGSKNAFKFPAFDQGLLNAYFTQKPYLYLRAVLTWEWNYKAYWGHQPSSSSSLDHNLISPPRILHFHGPKPGRGLDCLASMNSSSSICDSKSPYATIIGLGFQADGGLFANQTLARFNHYANSHDWEHANASRAV